MNVELSDTLGLTSPQRLNYATGMLLAKADFEAEQSYHRGRLARALALLCGSGTLAGLRVTANAQSGELHVEPGLALDCHGRMIELQVPACLRLPRWYEQQSAADLAQAHHVGEVTPDDAGPALDGVVADVFVRFHACESGKTPAFANGPFDALDAVSAARIVDSYEVAFLLRREGGLAGRLPRPTWPRDEAALKTHILDDAWRELYAPDIAGGLAARPELLAGQAPEFVFLARVVFPCAAPPPRKFAELTGPVVVANLSRTFVHPPSALGRALLANP